MYRKEQLANGARIVTEEINYVNSVSIGIWVRVGSRNEERGNNGVSHFIEHMLFKGTKNRTAKEIANSIDKIGGQINAFTAKECTCYYAKVLDSHFDIALDVLSDMFFNSNFDAVEIEKEKGVVLEEISMYEDSPEDQVHDLFSQMVWSNNSLGMPVLGTVESLKSLNKETVLKYYHRNYIPENVVISVVGNIKHEVAVEMIRKKFEVFKAGENKQTEEKSPDFNPNYYIKNKDTEQVHLCVGFNSINLSNKSIYSLLVLNNLLGGSMSSRLFQKIREEKGLAYSVFSYPSSYHDCGLFSIYAGLKPSQINNVTSIVTEEIKLIKNKGISDNELFDSKEQLKGSYTLGLESTSGRMISIGKSELLLNKIYSPNEVLEKIDNVNMDSVNDMISRVFNFDNMGAVLIGKVEKDLSLKDLFVK